MSSKKTNREIRETVRNEVSREYKHRIEHLQDSYNKMRDFAKKAEQERDEAIKRAEDAEEKLRQYEDWIERLQEFCNMTDEDRQIAIDEFRNSKKVEKQFEVNPIFNSELFKYLKFLM